MESAASEELAPAEMKEPNPTITAEESNSERGSKRPREADNPPFSPPAEAGDLQFAQLWYYRDNAGQDQGPFDAENMRTWFGAGYFTEKNAAAPSYYGEVPVTFWPIDKLYENPSEEAFKLASSVVRDGAAKHEEEFIPSATFTGERTGYVFKLDDYGVGYYLDRPEKASCTSWPNGAHFRSALVTVTWVSLERERHYKEELRRRLDRAQHFAGEGPS